MTTEIWLWIGFNLFVILMLALDLGVFHRKNHEVKVKEALIWTFVWITLALIFNYGIYYFQGKEKALEFLTGYLIEKSLSVDNIFVFILIFSYFNVPTLYQHKVLFWGIIGALVMRAIFIFAGVALINKFHWVIYIFAVFLVFTGIKMLLQREQKIDPDKNPVVRLFKKMFSVTDSFHGDKFFVTLNAKTYATPLFIVVLMVEVTDLIFAVDSIPAILAITKDPLIVYSSNVFAILGLRSLYFALAGMHKSFRYLKFGLAAILIFVGIKMFLSGFYPIPILMALIIIAVILLTSVIASLVIKPKP
ncbi:MAG: TerC family protein, partial [Bacteroidota bacterium]|nr:TerC family protein [Bacteroidota bacterium]